MSNGFSYKSNILYLNLKYGIIKKSQVQYLSFVRWIRFERKETDADGSFYIPINGIVLSFIVGYTNNPKVSGWI